MVGYGLSAHARKCQLSDGRSLTRVTAFGRFLPVLTTACAGQVEYKQLVSTNANDWSVGMQMGG